MNPPESRYRKVEALYQNAIDLPPEERSAFLAGACDNDEVKEEVISLLEHYEAARGSFLERPAHGLDGGPDSAPLAPQRIGRYRILGRLGEGGMGIVYRAEQESPRREVAVKVMRVSLGGSDALKRFELEAAILGRLKHPGIAQIYEAGMHEDSESRRPFFAMELIDGPPLMTYVAKELPDIRGRLELFIRICDAVNYAHQKGVVHRDLKPANILVVPEAPEASRGESNPASNEESSQQRISRGALRAMPKVLDFGVARATDSDLQATTMHTQAGQVVGTLPYMSPEQVAGEVQAIDTRSDVYSLGVILYELLSGRLPFDVGDKGLAAAARTIVEEDPRPLATMNRSFRGDLDTIVRKALEKEPERRYASALDLAGDVQRYLRDEPISARPGTTIYQFRKFARRNRAMVTVAGAAAAMLAIGATVSTSLAVSRTRALEESERQREIAQAVNDFLNKDLLASANPANQPDRDVTVKEVVDRAAEVIRERFPNQPLIEAGIRLTLSDTYKSLGEYAKSTEHAERALELYRAHVPADARDALRAANKLGQIKYNAGDMDEAERLLRDALASVTARFGPEDELTLSITNNLALVLERKDLLPEAAAMFERVFEARMRLFGEEHKKTRTSMNNLALVYVSMGRYAKAEPLHVKELELGRRLDGPEHPDTLISLNNLAVLYGKRKQYGKAEPLIHEALQVCERALGPDHPKTLTFLNTLAWHYRDVKQEDKAEAVFGRILETSQKNLGTDHPLTVMALNGLSAIYMSTDRLQEAETVGLKIYEWQRKVRGEDHVETGAALKLLTRIYWKQGKLEEAEDFGRRGYEILVRSAGPEHVATREIATTLRDIYQQLGRTAEAKEWEARQNPSSSTPTTASGPG